MSKATLAPELVYGLIALELTSSPFGGLRVLFSRLLLGNQLGKYYVWTTCTCLLGNSLTESPMGGKSATSITGRGAWKSRINFRLDCTAMEI